MFSHFFLFVFALARSALSIFILFNDYLLRCKEIVFVYIVKLSCRCQYFIYQFGNLFLKAVLFISLIGFLKPRANGRNIVGQQLPTLLDVTCCVRLHTLLHVVGCCLLKV